MRLALNTFVWVRPLLAITQHLASPEARLRRQTMDHMESPRPSRRIWDLSYTGMIERVRRVAGRCGVEPVGSYGYSQ